MVIPLGVTVYPGVHGAVEPLRSISNSVVKRSSGDNSWGVAPCENSSMPGKNLFQLQSEHLPCRGGFRLDPPLSPVSIVWPG